MTDRTRDVLRWSPRLLGIAVALFVALFAGDALREGRTGPAAAREVALHLVLPLVLLATVAVAWRRAWVGAAAFLGLAALYAATTARRPDWVLVVAGPLALVGALYALSWRRAR